MVLSALKQGNAHYKTRGGTMDDGGKIISVRMKDDEILEMDSYLEEHPELGGRSLFIRNAIRAYVDRDADVPATKTKNEVAVRLANAELDTIDSMIQDGIYIDRSDAVRSMIRDSMGHKKIAQEIANSKYMAASTQSR